MSRRVQRPLGQEQAMELLHALLDLGDAISAALGWVAFWYTWVAPTGRKTRAPRPSGPDEVEQFLRIATVRAAGDSPT